MSGEGETARRNSQFFAHLKNAHKPKGALISSKSQQIENITKQALFNRDHILKDTFYEMTRWRCTRSSSRSHTANDSLVTNQRPSRLKQLLKHPQAPSQTEATIIHDTFSHFFQKKHKFLDIGLSPFVIKKKGKFEKNGVGELASKIAQTKPLKLKDNCQSKKVQERRLRLRHKKEEVLYQNQHSACPTNQEQIFVPRGVSFSERQSPARAKASRSDSFRTKLGDHFHPWRQNEDNGHSPLKLTQRLDCCLSEIIE